MDDYLFRPDESEEFETEERCHILEIINDPSETKLSLARARVLPGVTTAWHRLKGTTETYYILNGQGLVEIGESMQKNVKSGDAVLIPADTAQRITNTGETDLLFLCYCAPSFGAESYESLE
ncbi:MAG: cupin domain-containing protein [Saprospiraceae bacterium]|nr:cupin domain-containing protein [Saprospiraceae bacterium]